MEAKFRNPFDGFKVSKYSLSPDVVDCLAFCTKNPYPMLEYLDELKEKYNMIYYTRKEERYEKMDNSYNYFISFNYFVICIK